MIGDTRITLLAFFAAAFLHLIILVLASYTPWRMMKPEPPEIPSPTRYVVRFQQPSPTAVPTPVPKPPEIARPIDPVLPRRQPLSRQPTLTPQPAQALLSMGF